MVTTTPSYWSTQNCQARAAQFGKLLIAWRNRCGYAQADIPKWADICGFVGPAIGTVSQLERGRVTTPTMGLFAGLAEVNRRLVEQDWSGLTSRRLLDRISGGVPITDATGRPWEFHDFCNAFHLPHLVSGELWDAINSAKAAPPELTDEELERVNTTLHQGYRSMVRRGVPPSTALHMASRFAPPGERPAYERALGVFGYEAEELQSLWDAEHGEWAPLIWWQQLQDQQQAA